MNTQDVVNALKAQGKLDDIDLMIFVCDGCGLYSICDKKEIGDGDSAELVAECIDCKHHNNPYPIEYCAACDDDSLYFLLDTGEFICTRCANI